jgi:hypothetical protein
MTYLEDFITQKVLFLKVISVKFSYFNHLIYNIVKCHFNQVMYSLCFIYFPYVYKVNHYNKYILRSMTYSSSTFTLTRRA